MVPTVALLNVEVEGTHYVACRGLVARARQVALAIARSKLKRDARRYGVAPRGASRKSISYVIDAELVGAGAFRRLDHVVVGRHNSTRASNEKPPISWRPGCDRKVACVKCIARGRELAIGGGARRRSELEGDAPVPGDGYTSCGTLRQRIAGRGTMLIGTSATGGPCNQPSVGGAHHRGKQCEQPPDHSRQTSQAKRRACCHYDNARRLKGIF